MPRYGKQAAAKLSSHPTDVARTCARKFGLESPAALRQRRIIRRLEAATSVASPMRRRCLNWVQTATSLDVRVTAALPPEADMRLRCNICRDGPKRDLGSLLISARSVAVLK